MRLERLNLELVSPQNRAKLMNIGHFRKKSIFNFCTTISSNRQEFRTQIEQRLGKRIEDAVGSHRHSKWIDAAARDSLDATTSAPPSGKWIPSVFVSETDRKPWEFWSVPAAPKVRKFVIAQAFRAHVVSQSAVYAATNWHAVFVFFYAHPYTSFQTGHVHV